MPRPSLLGLSEVFAAIDRTQRALQKAANHKLQRLETQLAELREKQPKKRRKKYKKRRKGKKPGPKPKKKK